MKFDILFSFHTFPGIANFAAWNQPLYMNVSISASRKFCYIIPSAINQLTNRDWFLTLLYDFAQVGYILNDKCITCRYIYAIMYMYLPLESQENTLRSKKTISGS